MRRYGLFEGKPFEEHKLNLTNIIFGKTFTGLCWPCRQFAVSNNSGSPHVALCEFTFSSFPFHEKRLSFLGTFIWMISRKCFFVVRRCSFEKKKSDRSKSERQEGVLRVQ